MWNQLCPNDLNLYIDPIWLLLPSLTHCLNSIVTSHSFHELHRAATDLPLYVQRCMQLGCMSLWDLYIWVYFGGPWYWPMISGFCALPSVDIESRSYSTLWSHILIAFCSEPTLPTWGSVQWLFTSFRANCTSLSRDICLFTVIHKEWGPLEIVSQWVKQFLKNVKSRWVQHIGQFHRVTHWKVLLPILSCQQLRTILFVSCPLRWFLLLRLSMTIDIWFTDPPEFAFSMSYTKLLMLHQCYT
jgi:hypothetical protein